MISTYPTQMILDMWPDEDILMGKLSLAGQDARPSLDYFIDRISEYDT